MKKLLRSLLLLSFIAGSFKSLSHSPGQSYVYLRVYQDKIDGRFEITTQDLEVALGVKLKDDLSVVDLDPYRSAIHNLYLSNVGFSVGSQNYPFTFKDFSLLTIDWIGTYVLIHFELEGITAIPDDLDVSYNVLLDEVDNHQGAVIIEYNWNAGIFNNESLPSLFFSRGSNAGSVNLTDGSVFQGFVGMVWEGIWHIWIGLDHILFLLALILPSVIIRRRKESSDQLAFSSILPLAFSNDAESIWSPVDKFRPAFLYIVKIVTSFTVAHSITLLLAALNLVVLPSRFVESIIAFSIGLAALHNISPLFKTREWILAFGFGLFHGFGFASVLSSIRSGEYVGLTVLGFNIGVEIGQLAIILVIFPILFLLRKRRIYPPLLVIGSIGLILISIYWFVERAFDIDLPAGALIQQLFG
ncbi:MAG: HupE/UreJ family protein [Bacteroidota bacterium]